MVQFVMPKLGADMTRGKLVEWCKSPGDQVKRGDTLAVIETDKANVDTESFVDGVLETVLVEPHDEWLPIGTPLALIRLPGESEEAFRAPPPDLELVLQSEVGTGAAPAVATGRSAAPSPAARVPGSAVPAAASGARAAISPAARKRIADLGLDAAAIVGTGPGGRITLEDVEQAAHAGATAASAGAGVVAAAPSASASSAATAPAAMPAPSDDRAARMRDAIAATMSRSKREIPHYYLDTTIAMAAAMQWLAERNASRPVTERVLAGALLLKATALALREVPELNGFWRDGRAQRSKAIHVGVAISLRGGGLVAPALHDTDRLSLDELMRALQDLTQRARASSLRSSEMTDPTVTVTSLGDRGVEAVYGVIYPPQLALVGFGRIVERPWIVDGRIVPAPVVRATLSADHRASDGHRGALLLDALDNLLQHPERL